MRQIEILEISKISICRIKGHLTNQQNVENISLNVKKNTGERAHIEERGDVSG